MSWLLVTFALLLVQIPLAPAQTGTATGIVRTTAGAPASGVRVAAQALTDSTAGIGEGALVSLTQTDSEGRYKLENIPPGRYYIQAGLVDLPTYYPGVSTTNGARSIQITPGAALERLDFSLTQLHMAPAVERAHAPVTLDQAEQEMIHDALARCGGNVAKAADMLGLSRAALYRRLEKFGIRVPE